MAGAAGAPRRLPSETDLGTPGRQPPRLAIELPSWPESGSTAAAPPRPSGIAAEARMAAGLPGPPIPAAPKSPPPAAAQPGAPLEQAGPAATPMTAPAPLPTSGAEMPPGGADFQNLRLHQHTVNQEGTYQHLDLGLTGLVAATGVWREIRLKLFDRRGTVGLEFRRIKGWPPMFEAWPQGGTDQYGPYWRLETVDTLDSMVKLTTAQDRALIAALLEVLPALARRGARMAGLPAEMQAAWSERGRALAAAVDATRPGQARPTARSA